MLSTRTLTPRTAHDDLAPKQPVIQTRRGASRPRRARRDRTQTSVHAVQHELMLPSAKDERLRWRNLIEGQHIDRDHLEVE